MNELRQPSTNFGVVNDTLDETIIIDEKRPEADYHIVTRPTKKQSSNSSNITNTIGHNAEPLFLEHLEPTELVRQIAQPIEQLALKKPRTFILSPERYAHLQR